MLILLKYLETTNMLILSKLYQRVNSLMVVAVNGGRTQIQF